MIHCCLQVSFTIFICMNGTMLFTGDAFSKAQCTVPPLFLGNIIAMSLVQGGPGPFCFASWVYNYSRRCSD